MCAATAETLIRRSGDSGYGRLLRRLDQALDMAHTRQWMGGEAEPPELELKGLSEADLLLLQQILCALAERTPLPGVSAQAHNTRH